MVTEADRYQQTKFLVSALVRTFPWSPERCDHLAEVRVVAPVVAVVRPSA
jgi:hypothetical protein